MANFSTHIGCSASFGVIYAGVAHFGLDFPLTSSLVAGGLCSIAGMLPDLDSDQGVPRRELLCLTAAAVPLLMMPQLHAAGWNMELMTLSGMVIYGLVRFVLGWCLQLFTVHRGMFHSLPALLIFSLAGFILCQCTESSIRWLKASAIGIGFASHLLLDELYSVEWRGGLPRLKKSFGTAWKWMSEKPYANLVAYGILIFVCWLSYLDLSLGEKYTIPEENGVSPTESLAYVQHIIETIQGKSTAE